MFDDPKKELQRLQEQLLAAESGKGTSGGQKTQKKPVAERYVSTKGTKPKKSPRTKKKSEKRASKDKTGGLQTALLLELAVLAAIVIWWKLWN